MNGMGRDDGNTALMYAISNNMYQVVFELLGTTICNRETALTWAFKKSKYDIAIKILQHTDANISNVPSKFLWYISDMIHKDRETLNETIEENKNLKDNLKMLSDMMHQDRETLHKTIEENKDLKNNLEMLSDMIHQDKETLCNTIEENKDLKNTLVVRKKNDSCFITTYY